MNPLDDSPFQLQHEILVFDGYLQKPLENANRESHAKQFVQAILRVLGMEPLGEFQFHDAVDDRAPGWSFIQAITTSHISCHYFEKPGRKPHIRLDLYSCRSVDWQKVIEVTHEYLCLEDWKGTFIERYLDGEGQRKIFNMHGKGNLINAKDCVFDGDFNHAHAQLKKATPMLV